MMKCILFVLAVSFQQVFLASGHGVVKIQFIKYENSKGLGANGHCCDGKWGICQRNGCDHMFTLCLDGPGRKDDLSRCQYGRMQSKAIKNQNVNTFGGTIADLSNPLVFTINSAFPPEFDFKVIVYDQDTGLIARDNDHVDTMTQRIKTQPEQSYITKSRTRLVTKVSMACSQHYYGVLCDKHCPAPSATSHYKCDLSTGQKVCLPGWIGADCQTKEKKPCDNNPCQHGGTCVEEKDAASCKCTSQFEGQRCETLKVTPAPPKKGPCDTGTLICKNRGLCLELSDSKAKCICIGEFTGTTCETAIKVPILPAGTPAKDEPAGDEIDKHCPTPSATSHYKCDLSTGQKVCLPGWIGADCQTKEKKPCDNNPCLHGGTCVEEKDAASCKCTSQFEGQRCETLKATPAPPKKGPCDTGTLICKNRGLCLELSDSKAKCICIGEFTGTTCETAIKAPVIPAGTPAKDEPAVDEIDEFFMTPEPSAPPMQSGDNDCDTLAKGGFLYRDGVYNVKPKGSSDVISVFCDMTTDGWTVIQRRKKGTLNFNQDWKNYKEGFGEVGASEDFWLGLENIHLITAQNPAKYKLKIKMKMHDGVWLTAEYSQFSIDDEAHDYKLHVSGYSGTAGDALGSLAEAGRHMHNGQHFSTSDRDKDNSKLNCAQKFKSGWWFNDCLEGNLNGPILEVSPIGKPSCGDSACMNWNALAKYKGTPIKASIMMMKPN